MNRNAAFALITLLYFGVVAGTAIEPDFRAAGLPAFGFYLLTGLSLLLSLLMLQRGEAATCWMKQGFVAVQVLLFFLLNLLPVPRPLIWLLAMPVLGHVVFFLPWAAVAGAIGAYMGIFLWASREGIHQGADVARISIQYGAACLFTVVFARITRGAIEAREEAGRLAAELGRANERLRESAEGEKRRAALAERNRIARDIHDGLGHHLTTISVQLEVARTLVRTRPEEADAALAKAQRQAGEALADVRRSVRTLRTDEPPPQLSDTIGGLINESGLDAHFEIHGSPRTLGGAQTQALFRVVQEALTNVRKHAGSREVWIELKYLAASTEVVVGDNGRGASGGGNGFGLSGLRERIEALGGRFQAGNRAAGGFEVKAEIPL